MSGIHVPCRFLAFPTLLLLFATLGPPLATNAEDAPSSRKAARDDFAKLQGTWQCVEMEREGGLIPADDLKGSTATYEDDRVTLTRDGEAFRHGLVTLDPSKSPKRINSWDLDGPFEDQTVPGIYEIEGDTLKICFSRPGSERPAKFTTKEGSGTILGVYRRKKP